MIIPFAEVDGLPVVPTASHVVKGAGDHYYAFGEETTAPQGGITRRAHRCIAKMYRGAAGVYDVAVDAADLAAIDPGNAAKTLEQYKLTPGGAAWPHKKADGTIAIPETTGAADPRPVILPSDRGK